MPLAGAVDFDLRVALEDSEPGKDEANSTLGDGERVRARRVDMERLLDECECECELRLKASAAGMFIMWSSTSTRTGACGRKLSVFVVVGIAVVVVYNSGEGKRDAGTRV